MCIVAHESLKIQKIKKRRYFDAIILKSPSFKRKNECFLWQVKKRKCAKFLARRENMQNFQSVGATFSKILFCRALFLNGNLHFTLQCFAELRISDTNWNES